MKKTYVEYILRFRLTDDLSFSQLAAKLDLDSTNLNKIYTRKCEFDEKLLEKLGIVFKLNYEKLNLRFSEI